MEQVKPTNGALIDVPRGMQPSAFRNDGDDKTWDEICKLSQQHLFLTKPQLMQALLRDKYQELYAKVLKS